MTVRGEVLRSIVLVAIVRCISSSERDVAACNTTNLRRIYLAVRIATSGGMLLIIGHLFCGLDAVAAVTAAKEILWRAPQKFDVTAVRVSKPAPPFHFVREDLSGRSPKVEVRDARGRLWSVKFGEEARAEAFAARFIGALGFYSDATYYLHEGQIRNAKKLKRSRRYIDSSGSFRDARFEYRDPSCRLLEDANWSWQYNPFLGTREFGGLKILVMLLSNWDHKDAEDGDSNNGILECSTGGSRTRFYYVADWGGSLGKWGRKFVHNRWDCEGFAEQTPKFVKGVACEERVEFGFTSGRRAGEFKADITLGDVRWAAERLRHVSDAQLRVALKHSGADRHEVDHFSQALRMRIAALQQAGIYQRTIR